MLNPEKKRLLQTLFKKKYGSAAKKITLLPPSGSHREYYRMVCDAKTAMGVYNNDKKENLAFISYTKQFLRHNMPVPGLYAENLAKNVYLLQDLGDTTLYFLLQQERTAGTFPEKVIGLYKKTLTALACLQIKAGQNFDYQCAYPRAAFDKQSIMWDLNYFKYHFLKLMHIPFDEQALEDDFHKFADYLCREDAQYFMFRDFQSRNIMIYDNQPYFIDYQGGRKGALQYDLASILYDSKANLPDNIRHELYEHYVNKVAELIPLNKTAFREYFQAFVLVRKMQAMGAYGYRGLYEQKQHFIKSIPFAIENLQNLLKRFTIPLSLPELNKVFSRLIHPDKRIPNKEKKLCVRINSFSYRRGIPTDHTGNGGGFVFDCRALHNPGRYKAYKTLTGKDQKVIDFLETKSRVKEFLEQVYKLVDNSVDVYKKRDFTDLMINFGCTGGQHRSVYCAEALTKHLTTDKNLEIKLQHLEID